MAGRIAMRDFKEQLSGDRDPTAHVGFTFEGRDGLLHEMPHGAVHPISSHQQVELHLLAHTRASSKTVCNHLQICFLKV